VGSGHGGTLAGASQKIPAVPDLPSSLPAAHTEGQAGTDRFIDAPHRGYAVGPALTADSDESREARRIGGERKTVVAMSDSPFGASSQVRAIKPHLLGVRLTTS